VTFWVLLLLGVAAWLGGYHLIGAACLGGICVWAFLTVRNARSESEGKAAQEQVAPSVGEPYRLSLKSADVNGWDSVELYPSCHQYERQLCFGGPPTFEEGFEYEVRGRTDVVERLRDRYREGLDGKEWNVINGRVVVPGGRAHQEVVWHELFGPIKYLILAHTLSARERTLYFEREKRRIQGGFDAVAIEANKLGAIWNSKYGFYDVAKDASEGTKQALHSLHSAENLGRHGLVGPELSTYEDILSILTFDHGH
jgi:hypothetical protein